MKTFFYFSRGISAKVLLPLLSFLFICCHSSTAQTPTPIITFNGSNPTYVYVGSLTKTSTDNSNNQKLKIDLLGGDWMSSTVGETTFYISNRGGLVINQVTTGGAGIAGNFSLQAYQNGSNTDFYLYTPATAYSAIAVLSYLFDGSGTNSQQFATITKSYSIPAGTAITPLSITPIMTTDASGNISINSSNTYPQYKLAVNGAMVVTSATVKVYKNWPDYVFHKDYSLPSLNNLKTYIDQNHHLPEIPTEAEVYKNGLNLGEMDKKLVKKVEELTLYLIEKDKSDAQQSITIRQLRVQLTAQQAQIDQLKNQLASLIKNQAKQ